MRHHYYWNTEMPDSSTLDFTVDPAKFFTTLLSEKDRFSWCEVNRDYKTRGVNPGSTVPFDSVYVFNNQKIGYPIYDQFDDNVDIRSFAVRMKSAKISTKFSQVLEQLNNSRNKHRNSKRKTI